MTISRCEPVFRHAPNRLYVINIYPETQPLFERMEVSFCDDDQPLI